MGERSLLVNKYQLSLSIIDNEIQGKGNHALNEKYVFFCSTKYDA